jgi:RNA polymerase sigma factor (sigma-70 family)
VDEREWLAERFEEHRTHLRAVAYRMLGSVSEADDAVQEAWLRLSRSDGREIENMGGWLTTVVGRVCLNMLRSRRTRREDSLEVHVPEPIVSREDGVDPEHEALLADSVGLAMLVVLETLSPAERLAFVLHDIFGVPFEEIGARRRRLASWRAARAGACRARPRPRTPIWCASERWSTPSSRQPARATSMRSWRCSTRTWCCVPTAGPRARARRTWSTARRQSAGER